MVFKQKEKIFSNNYFIRLTKVCYKGFDKRFHCFPIFSNHLKIVFTQKVTDFCHTLSQFTDN